MKRLTSLVRLRESVNFLARVIWAVLWQRPLELKRAVWGHGQQPKVWLWPNGSYMPQIAGGSPESDPSTGDPPPDPPADPPSDPPKKTFSQEDLDRIVSDRLARDRRDRPSDEEIEKLREKAEAHDEAEQANQSELDKARTRAEQAEAKAEEAEKKVTEATEGAQDLLRRAEIITAASKLEAVNPDAVHALLKEKGFKAKDGDNELEVTIGDDGQVTNAEEVVKAFLEADENKYLVGSTPDPGPGDGGARQTPGKGLTKQQLDEMSPNEVAELDQDEVDKALAEG